MPLTAVYSKTLIKRKRRMMGNKTLKGEKKGQWTQIESYGDSKLKSICAWASRFIASWPAEVEFFILSRENRRVQIWNWAALGSFKLENVQPVCHMRHRRVLAVFFFLLEGVCPARRSWGLQPEQLMREAGRLAARWLESWTRRFKCIIWTLACWGFFCWKGNHFTATCTCVRVWLGHHYKNEICWGSEVKNQSRKLTKTCENALLAWTGWLGLLVFMEPWMNYFAVTLKGRAADWAADIVLKWLTECP